MDQLLVTMAQAAQLASVSTKTIQRLVLSGEIPSVHIGRSRRIVYAGLVEWIERKKSAA